MALAPNCKKIVEALAAEYPQEFKDCHRPELGARAWAFIRRVAWVLHSTVDQRFGLNGKRGNTNDPSMDAVSFRSPASEAGGVEVIDVVGGAGAAGASPAWNDVTKATINAGTVGAYIQPQPVNGTSTPPVLPPPVGVDPTPNPPVVVCPCEGDIAGAYEALTKIIMLVQSLADRNEQLHATAVGHIDDAKGRIERVSQELANKPVNPPCRLRF
jgi:hypothetical protein